MRFRIVLLFTLFCSIPFLHAQEASQGAMLKRSIAHNGEMRDYFVFLPLGEFTDPLPVVFGIHGSSWYVAGGKDDFERQLDNGVCRTRI